jgi:predicted SAM-dependent methyltransferase
MPANGSNMQVHLGCGDDRLPGFINIDCRATRAADYVADLNELRCFEPNSVALFYSHAFFEHLYRNKRVPHLRSLVVALQPGGACCYIGLPYFRNIAKMYLEGAPGVVGERFDLYNVYRYTHGDPEQAPDWWLEQLHKSLFDEPELIDLLSQAGFSTAALFTYCYVGERGKPVNLGFFATKSAQDSASLQGSCLHFLSEHCANKVLLDTVEFISIGPCAGGKSVDVL